MTAIGALVTFAVSWWLFFFMALPFGVRQQEEPVPGSDPGAPQKPRLLIKVLVATVMAALATWGLAVFIDSGLVDLRAR